MSIFEITIVGIIVVIASGYVLRMLCRQYCRPKSCGKSTCRCGNEDDI